MFISGGLIEQLAPILSARDFYRERHAIIYQAMVDVAARGEGVDYMTVIAQLESTGHLDGAGGVPYLSGLLGSVVTLANVETYAGMITQTAYCRRLISAAGKIASLGYQSPGKPTDVVQELAENILDVAQGPVAPSDFDGFPGALETYMGALTARRDGTVTEYLLPTKFLDLDKITNGGFERGDLVVIGARPSIGKTGLAMALANNVAVQGLGVAVFSLEMSTSQLVGRLVSMKSNLERSQLTSSSLKQEELERLGRAFGSIAEMSMFIDDSSSTTVVAIRARLRRLMTRETIDMVIIDHLQLLTMNGRPHENRVQEMSEISRTLKGLAKDLNVPVVVLSQLSREVERRKDKQPVMSDLRESGAIEQDADLILLLYRDDYYNEDSPKKGIMDINVAKQRNGGTGSLKLGFNQRTGEFFNVEETRPS